MMMHYSDILLGDKRGTIEWRDGVIISDIPGLEIFVKSMADMHEKRGGLYVPILGTFDNILTDPISFDALIFELFGNVPRTGDELPERIILDDDGNPLPDDVIY